VSSVEAAKCATSKGVVPSRRSASLSVRLVPTGESALGMACATPGNSAPATMDIVARHAALHQVHICIYRTLKHNTSLHYVAVELYQHNTEVVIVVLSSFAVAVNECLNSNGGCAHTCVDTSTSYRCECRRGYQLATNGRSCNGMQICNSA
jgi:hypothetical protein